MQISRVINQSQLKDFVDRLPQKVNTIVGERGSSISGGEKQRIGIARALFRDPEILIFDESTNSLDAETEDKFMKVVSRIKDNKIVIFISHQKKILSELQKKIYFRHEEKHKSMKGFSRISLTNKKNFKKIINIIDKFI